MANNAIIYNGALAGMVSAIESGRSIRSVTAAQYSDVIAAATAFATQLDAAIPTNNAYTQQEGDLVLAICSQILVGKFWKADSSFTNIIAAIKALFTQAGAAIVAAPAVPSAVGLDGSTLPQTFTLAPAGHQAGIYAVSYQLRVRTVAGAGQVTLTLGWTGPNSGAATFVLGGISLTSLTLTPATLRAIVSNGLAPITVAATVSVGITGSPVFDIYATTVLQGRS